MRPLFLLMSSFAWLIVPAMLYGGYRLHGLPHVIWSYDFYGSHADWSSRHYTRCTFIGPYGAIMTYPADGSCPWVAFFKQSEAPQ